MTIVKEPNFQKIKVAIEMMSLMTEEELATLLSRLEQQELDCQTGSGTVPGRSGLQLLLYKIRLKWTIQLKSS